MKFVAGMLLGVGAGVAATLLLRNRNEYDGISATVQANAQRALESAKLAAAAREKELWREYHLRVPTPPAKTLG